MTTAKKTKPGHAVNNATRTRTLDFNVEEMQAFRWAIDEAEHGIGYYAGHPDEARLVPKYRRRIAVLRRVLERQAGRYGGGGGGGRYNPRHQKAENMKPPCERTNP